MSPRASDAPGEAAPRLRPIGVVEREAAAETGRATSTDRAAGDRAPARIRLDAACRDGLLHLDRFSHVLVLWWADRLHSAADRATLRVHPRPAPQRLMGVFATRSPARPNPIAVTVCRLRAVDEAAGTLLVDDLDADDGSPVLDIKPYLPSNDRVRDAHGPDWFPPMPEWACEDETRPPTR